MGHILIIYFPSPLKRFDSETHTDLCTLIPVIIYKIFLARSFSPLVIELISSGSEDLTSCLAKRRHFN